MYCGAQSLVKNEPDHRLVTPLRCKRWTCEDCAPLRQRELKRLARAGIPNTFLTLSVNPSFGSDPLDRAHRLRNAWRNVVRRAKIEATRNPEARPSLYERRRHWNEIDWLTVENRVRARDRIPPSTPVSRRDHEEEWQAEIAKRKKWPRQVTLDGGQLPYLIVFELTKKGEPHVHIAARTRWVGQAWLAREMDAIMRAPVVDVRRIRDLGRVAYYVAKYMGKDPHRFEGCKRYWRSLDYAPGSDDDGAVYRDPKTSWAVRQRTFGQILAEARRYHWHIIQHPYSAELWPPSGDPNDYRADHRPARGPPQSQRSLAP